MPKQWFKRMIYLFFLSVLRFFEPLIMFFIRKRHILLPVTYPSMSQRSLQLARRLREHPDVCVWVTMTRPDVVVSSETESLRREFRHIPYQLARFIKWDLILFTNHNRSFRSESPKFYLRHGLSVNKVDEDGNIIIFGKLGRDQSGGIIYDKVFVESPCVHSLIAGRYPEFQERLVVGGDIEMELIDRGGRDRREVFERCGFDEKKQIVMIQSTWGKSLLNCGDERLLDVLPVLQRRYNVVVSLHPKTVHSTDDKYDPGTRDIIEYCRRSTGCVCVDDGSWTSLVHHCDYLVSDYTSALFYALPYVHGVVLVDIPSIRFWENSPVRELGRIATVVRRLGDVPYALERESATCKKALYEEFSHTLFGDYKHSTQVHVRFVSDFLKLRYTVENKEAMNECAQTAAEVGKYGESVHVHAHDIVV